MIVNRKNQLGLAFDLNMQEEIFKMHYNKYIEPVKDMDTKIGSMVQITDLLRDEKNHHYLFKETAKDIASRIKLDKGKFEDFSFITDKLPVKKCTYLVGKDKFFRWVRWSENSDILVICVKLVEPDAEFKDEINNMKIAFSGLSDNQIKKMVLDSKQAGDITEKQYISLISSIDNKNFDELISKGYVYYMWGINEGKLSFPQNERNEDFFADMMEFVKLLTFTELSELETVILPPNTSVGTKKQGKYLNQSNSKITIVDSTWNKVLIKGDSFRVSGHLRLQRYGENLSKVKLIFIDEFEKSGYTKNSLKN